MRCFSKVLKISVGLSLLMFGGCQTTRKIVNHATGWIPWVHSSEATPQANAVCKKTVKSHGITLTLHLEPVPVRLSETRRVEATLHLQNVSSRFILLEFATTQRFDMLVRDAAGKVVVQWSEDRVFEALPGSVGINPGEHLEYQAGFSTRDLQPGKCYTVTALVMGRSGLKLELPLVPEK